MSDKIALMTTVRMTTNEMTLVELAAIEQARVLGLDPRPVHGFAKAEELFQEYTPESGQHPEMHSDIAEAFSCEVNRRLAEATTSPILEMIEAGKDKYYREEKARTKAARARLKAAREAEEADHAP